MNFDIYHWLDLFWLPLPFILLPKHQWLEALIVIICASIMMRFQVELSHSMGFPNGMTGLLPYDPYKKAIVTYSTIIFLYMVLMLVLTRFNWRAHMLLSFSVFFNAFIISTIVLVI